MNGQMYVTSPVFSLQKHVLVGQHKEKGQARGASMQDGTLIVDMQYVFFVLLVQHKKRKLVTKGFT